MLKMYALAVVSALVLFVSAILLGAVLITRAQAQVITVPEVSKPLDVDRQVEALYCTEHWDGHTRGAAGEWGFWQFTPKDWEEVMPHIPQRAATMSMQREAARRRVRRILNYLPFLDLPETSYSVALVFTAGFGNVAKGRVTAKKSDYADRCQTIYDGLLK